MPIITSLRGAMRDANRVNVFLDGKFSFSLTISELADVKLSQGQTLSDIEVEKLKSQSGIGKLYQQTLEYCFSRPHSKKEVIDFLERKRQRRELAWKRFESHLQKLETDAAYAEKVKQIRQTTREKNQKIRETDFTENNTYEYRGSAKTNLPSKPSDRITDDMIEQVISRLEAQKVIDDAYFTRFYIENRHQSKGISQRRLIQELKQKGISDDFISGALVSDTTGELVRDEVAELQKMLKKQLQKTTDRQKLIGYLARQGFSYDLIKSEVDSALADFDSATDDYSSENYF